MKQARFKVVDPAVVTLCSGTSIKASNNLLSVTHPERKSCEDLQQPTL